METEEREVLCSGCLQVVPEAQAHVIPHFNEDAGMYVTTYRCEQCWLPAVAETRARVAGTDDADEIASAAAFFERHGMIVLEFRRGDPLPAVRQVLTRMIDMLKSGTIRLSIGPTVPLIPDAGKTRH
jgi:hypothetical protein